MEIITPGKVEVTGDMPQIERRSSGLHMLDIALAHEDETGLPIRTGIEIYGKPESGKSTLAYYLAGRVKPTGLITLIDLEGSGREDYVKSAVAQSGFDGTVHRVEWKDEDDKPRTQEDMLEFGANMLLEDQGDANAVILDSAAMVSPIQERESKLGSGFSKRANVLAEWSRRWVPWLNIEDDPKLVLIVNHMLANMGDRFDVVSPDYGFVTPGGFTLKFGCAARIRVRRKETFDDGEFEAKCKIDKLRYGGKGHKDREGRFIVIPGLGISPHMTAAFDCMELGYARRKNVVQILKEKGGKEWVNVARLKTMFQWAREGKVNNFKPFYERLGWEEDNV